MTAILSKVSKNYLFMMNFGTRKKWRLNGRGVEFRMLFIVKKYIMLDPKGIGFFCRHTVVFKAYLITHYIQ